MVVLMETEIGYCKDMTSLVESSSKTPVRTAVSDRVVLFRKEESMITFVDANTSQSGSASMMNSQKQCIF